MYVCIFIIRNLCLYIRLRIDSSWFSGVAAVDVGGGGGATEVGDKRNNIINIKVNKIKSSNIYMYIFV